MLIVSIVGFHEHDRCARQGVGALAHRAMPSGLSDCRTASGALP